MSLHDKTVDELYELARRHDIPHRSDMRKDELVEALEGAGVDGGGGASGGGDGGVRTGPNASDSLKYSQVVETPGEHEEREGRSLVTTSHDVIRQWAEARGAKPATVEGTGPGETLGVLRFMFPRQGDHDRLSEVSWDDFFATFDERGLNFIYQEHRSDGSESNFFKFENPNRANG